MSGRSADVSWDADHSSDGASLVGTGVPPETLGAAIAADGAASISQEVADFAAYTSLHEALLKRAILREAAKDAEPMRQLERWTHESLQSITAVCARYDRELGSRLHARSRAAAERFWNEVRAQAAQLQEFRARRC